MRPRRIRRGWSWAILAVTRLTRSCFNEAPANSPGMGEARPDVGPDRPPLQ